MTESDVALARIEGKLDSLHEKVDSMKSHGDRLARIEEWKRIVGYVLGGTLMAVIGVIVKMTLAPR